MDATTVTVPVPCDKQCARTATAVTSACNHDVTVLCDMQHATTTDGALEMYPGAGVANIGIMLFRSSAMIFAEVPRILLHNQIMSSHCGMNISQRRRLKSSLLFLIPRCDVNTSQRAAQSRCLSEPDAFDTLFG